MPASLSEARSTQLLTGHLDSTRVQREMRRLPAVASAKYNRVSLCRTGRLDAEVERFVSLDSDIELRAQLLVVEVVCTTIFKALLLFMFQVYIEHDWTSI